MTDADIVGHLARYGYGVVVQRIAFPRELVDDFREARAKKWCRAGVFRINEPGSSSSRTPSRVPASAPATS